MAYDPADPNKEDVHFSWWTQNGNKFNRQDFLLSGSPLNNWDYTNNTGNSPLIGHGQVTNDDVFIYPADLDITENMQDVEHIINYHQRFLLDKYTTKQDYYKGRHQAIISRSGVPLGQPDDRLINNIPKQLVDTFNGYAFGQTPDVSYDDPNQDDDQDDNGNPTDELINKWLSVTDFEEHVDELTKQASIYGRSYLYAYQLADGIHYAVCNPIDTIMVYDDTVSRNPMFAIRYENNYNGLTGTLITQQADYQFKTSAGVGSLGGLVVTNYEETTSTDDFNNDNSGIGSTPQQVIAEDRHPEYPCLPMFELYENRSRIGIFDDSINNIDDFNQIMSMKSNDVHSYSNNYLLVTGAKLDKNAQRNIQNNRIINLYKAQQGFSGEEQGPNPTAQFIQPEANDAMQENMLNRLRTEIYRTAQVVDPEDAADGQDANAISGVVLKQRYSKMHVKASLKSNILTKVLRGLFKIVFAETHNSADVMNLKFNYNFDDPHNILEEAQTASFMGNYPREAIYATTPDLLGGKTPQEVVADYEEAQSSAQQSVQQATDNYLGGDSDAQSSSSEATDSAASQQG